MTRGCGGAEGERKVGVTLAVRVEEEEEDEGEEEILYVYLDHKSVCASFCSRSADITHCCYTLSELPCGGILYIHLAVHGFSCHVFKAPHDAFLLHLPSPVTNHLNSTHTSIHSPPCLFSPLTGV